MRGSLGEYQGGFCVTHWTRTCLVCNEDGSPRAPLLRTTPSLTSSTDQGHLNGLDASHIILLFLLFFNKQARLSSDVVVDLVAKTSTCLLMLPGTFKLQQQIPDRVS